MQTHFFLYLTLELLELPPYGVQYHKESIPHKVIALALLGHALSPAEGFALLIWDNSI